MAKHPQKNESQPAKQQQQQGNHVLRSQSIEWQGPIPPPAALEHVDRVVPGGAERILKMAEQEQAHRIEMEKIVIGAEIQDSQRSKGLGASIAAFAILGAILNVYFDGAWQATCAFLGVPILGVVNALIRGRNHKE